MGIVNDESRKSVKKSDLNKVTTSLPSLDETFALELESMRMVVEQRDSKDYNIIKFKQSKLNNSDSYDKLLKSPNIESEVPLNVSHISTSILEDDHNIEIDMAGDYSPISSSDCDSTSPRDSALGSSPEIIEESNFPIQHYTPVMPNNLKRRPGRPAGSTRKYKSTYEGRKTKVKDNDEFSLRNYFEAGGRDYNEYLEWIKLKQEHKTLISNTSNSLLHENVPSSNVETISPKAQNDDISHSVTSHSQTAPVITSSLVHSSDILPRKKVPSQSSQLVSTSVSSVSSNSAVIPTPSKTSISAIDLSTKRIKSNTFYCHIDNSGIKQLVSEELCKRDLPAYEKENSLNVNNVINKTHSNITHENTYSTNSKTNIPNKYESDISNNCTVQAKIEHMIGFRPDTGYFTQSVPVIPQYDNKIYSCGYQVANDYSCPAISSVYETTRKDKCINYVNIMNRSNHFNTDSNLSIEQRSVPQYDMNNNLVQSNKSPPPLPGYHTYPPNFDVSHWDFEQVAKFVSLIPGCEEYAEVFKEHRIDGAILPHLSEDHLLNCVKMKLGPAIRMKLAIQRLRKD